jgi:NADH:ubiquinone oxidoreductase subunit 6 (subunit J)
MYGTWSATTFGLVIAAVAIVIAFAFWAAPLIAVIVAAVLIPVFVVGMLASRRREEERDPAAPESAVTPEGRPTSPTGSRSTGAPASGEG